MKYEKAIQTHNLVSDLKEDDDIFIKINNHTLKLNWSIASQTFEFRYIPLGGTDQKEPFLRISRGDMERLENSPVKGQYCVVTYPEEFAKEVKKRLQGLPILP